jgi:hypothetical protein
MYNPLGKLEVPDLGSKPYLMSFGTGGLYLKESLVIAALHHVAGSWEATSSRALGAGAFPVRKESSAKRSIREIVHRLRCLDAEELSLFLDGDRNDQLALLWLATCRAYRFIGEFAEEVIVDRYQSFRTDLSHDDFDIFFARKAEWSEKLAGISDSTRAKLRAVMFRLMREAGVITPDSRILGAMLSGRVVAAIERAGAGELRFFPGGQGLSAQARP